MKPQKRPKKPSSGKPTGDPPVPISPVVDHVDYRRQGDNSDDDLRAVFLPALPNDAELSDSPLAPLMARIEGKWPVSSAELAQAYAILTEGVRSADQAQRDELALLKQGNERQVKENEKHAARIKKLEGDLKLLAKVAEQVLQPIDAKIVAAELEAGCKVALAGGEFNREDLSAKAQWRIVPRNASMTAAAEQLFHFPDVLGVLLDTRVQAAITAGASIGVGLSCGIGRHIIYSDDIASTPRFVLLALVGIGAVICLSTGYSIYFVSYYTSSLIHQGRKGVWIPWAVITVALFAACTFMHSVIDAQGIVALGHHSVGVSTFGSRTVTATNTSLSDRVFAASLGAMYELLYACSGFARGIGAHQHRVALKQADEEKLLRKPLLDQPAVREALAALGNLESLRAQKNRAEARWTKKRESLESNIKALEGQIQSPSERLSERAARRIRHVRDEAVGSVLRVDALLAKLKLLVEDRRPEGGWTWLKKLVQAIIRLFQNRRGLRAKSHRPPKGEGA